MIDAIKQALKDASSDVTWAKGRVAMDDNAPKWLAALVKVYDAAEDWINNPSLHNEDSLRKALRVVRRKLEGK